MALACHALLSPTGDEAAIGSSVDGLEATAAAVMFSETPPAELCD